VGEIAAHVMHSSQRSLSLFVRCAGLVDPFVTEAQLFEQKVRTAHQSPMMDKRRIDNNRAGDAVRTD
jgi:hypothetical protein